MGLAGAQFDDVTSTGQQSGRGFRPDPALRADAAGLATAACYANSSVVLRTTANELISMKAEEVGIFLSVAALNLSLEADEFELELELIQTQMTQKPMLRAEVYARGLRASQNRKEDSV